MIYACFDLLSLFQLKSLPIEAVVAVAEKCHERQVVKQNAQTNWISDLWSSEINSKAGLAIMDFAMCSAARKRTDTHETKKIVSTWLAMLNLEANDSSLDLEVEKFVALDEHSTLSYIIGHRLVGKVATNTELAFYLMRSVQCLTNRPKPIISSRKYCLLVNVDRLILNLFLLHFLVRKSQTRTLLGANCSWALL